MLLNAYINRIVELGVNPALKIDLEFETAHKRAYRRTDEIATLISEKVKHTLVFASEFEYTYYVFDGERYTERPTGGKEGKEFKVY